MTVDFGNVGTTFFIVTDRLMYAGPESSPTIIPGIYNIDSRGSLFDLFGMNPQFLSGTVVVSAVPEPSTVSLMLIVAVAVLSGRLRRAVFWSVATPWPLHR